MVFIIGIMVLSLRTDTVYLKYKYKYEYLNTNMCDCLESGFSTDYQDLYINKH